MENTELINKIKDAFPILELAEEHVLDLKEISPGNYAGKCRACGAFEDNIFFYPYPPRASGQFECRGSKFKPSSTTGGDVIDYFAHVKKITRTEALAELAGSKRLKQKKETQEVFDYTRELEILNESEKKEERIVAFYFSFKGLTFHTAEAFKEQVKACRKSALKLVGYSSTEIEKAFEYCNFMANENGGGWKVWTLETVFKIIDQVQDN